jgi:hypothetical protein
MSVMSLVSSVLGYYISESLINKHDFTVSKYFTLWLGCAFVGGVVLGLGAYFSNMKNDILKYVGMNLLPAVFISEGMDKVIHLSEYKHMVIGVVLSIMMGIVLYFMVNRKDAFRKNNLLSVICLAIIGVAGFSLLSAF